MQQRKTKSHIDYFPTPPPATEKLMNWMIAYDYLHEDKSLNGTCLEPAAGGGHMVDVLKGHFSSVRACDLYDPAGKGYEKIDFVDPFDAGKNTHDYVITNPPFRLAEMFALRAIQRARRGVALLCRIAFLESQRRYDKLFSLFMPSDVLVFVNRVAMVEGKYDPKATSATCYAWFIWIRGGFQRNKWVKSGVKAEHPRIDWI